MTGEPIHCPWCGRWTARSGKSKLARHRDGDSLLICFGSGRVVLTP